MKTLLASLALLLPIAAQAAPAKTAAKPMAVCVAKATGVVTARPKCKAGEGPLSLASVAASAVGPQGPKGDQGPSGPQGITGPQGPQGTAGGIDFSTCYTKTDKFSSTFGLAIGTSTCNDQNTEFMLSDGFEKTRLVPTVGERALVFDSTGKVPTGVTYTTGYITTGTNSAYDLTITLVCCKR